MDQAQAIGTVVLATVSIIAIVKPILKLNSSIVELTVEMRNMRERDENRDKRIDKHGKEIDVLHDKVNDQAHELSNHETRIRSNELAIKALKEDK